ncbi:hypothetical protein M4Z64_23580, partial [Escherichia coli]|nr:hypothetical protein [Escherichia coli]
MGYRHGIYISELATSITPPVQVSAGLIVAFGTAPVNQLEDPASAVNKPIIAYTYAEAGNDSNLLIVFYVQIMPD